MDRQEKQNANLAEAARAYAEREKARVGCGTEFTTSELAEAVKHGAMWFKEIAAAVVEDRIRLFKDFEILFKERDDKLRHGGASRVRGAMECLLADIKKTCNE